LYSSDVAHAETLRERSRALGLAERVDFLGAVPYRSMPVEYRGAWALAHTSATGSLDKVVLEAMACRTPVVTSNISALPETAGDAALLVDPLDDRALAEAIARIVEDPVLAEDLALRGEKRAKAFTWGESARRTWAVYEEARDV
ncbi:MAG: glycosyltransferase, partial [Acidimicrobiia bacterium]